LWEAGAGIAYINFPDYRGSDQRSTFVLPIPYFVYRGEFLRVDRESVRGRLFESENVELNLSLNGSIPVDSSGNRARRGMPDLDPTLELGPSLNITLKRFPEHKARLDLRLPVRAVFASDFTYIDNVGWTTQPQLNLDVRDPLGHAGWKLGVLAGPIFADHRYHDYFYGVGPAFATAGRPAYEAPGGYTGTRFTVALSKRFPKFWAGGFLTWDTLEGAAYEDSPLVRQNQAFTGGFAVSWIFAESDRRVERTERTQ
jgi:outer membrane scaffolding protein for murein synthesis (MipA/OmpV family)